MNEVVPWSFQDPFASTSTTTSTPVVEEEHDHDHHHDHEHDHGDREDLPEAPSGSLGLIQTSKDLDEQTRKFVTVAFIFI